MSPSTFSSLGIIAGSGEYPFMVAKAARSAGIQRIVVAAFLDETNPDIQEWVDRVEWMRVGQIGKLIAFFKKEKIQQVMMAGQIAPKNLFNLRPDLKALMILARIPERNAESLFSAIANELFENAGAELIPATTFLEADLATLGHFAGPAPSKRQWKDVSFGLRIAKEISRLDIGQSAVVKNGTVLAVEGFEGTDQMILRAGELSGPKGGGLLVKVSKPHQDMRFDIPVIGPKTIEVAAKARLSGIVIEAGKTLLLNKSKVLEVVQNNRLTLLGV